MKIEGNRPAPDSEPVRRVDHQAQKVKHDGADRADKRTDRVQVSDDAKKTQGLVANAVKAAKELPDIRPEAVARGRAKLESGELGADHQKLARAMIADLLK